MAVPAVQNQQVNQQVIVGGYIIPAEPNSTGTMGPVDLLINRNKTGIGVYREVQWWERIANTAATILKDMGSSMASFFESVRGKLFGCWTVLCLPRLPEVTKAALLAIRDLFTKATSNCLAITQRIRDIAEAVGTWACVGMIGSENPALNRVAEGAFLAVDMTEATIYGQGFLAARDHLSQPEVMANPAVKEAVEGTKNYAFAKTLKSTLGATSGIIGLVGRTLGGPLLSPLSMVGMGLLTTTVARVADFYGDSRTYKVIDFANLVRAPQQAVVA